MITNIREMAAHVSQVEGLHVVILANPFLALHRVDPSLYVHPCAYNDYPSDIQRRLVRLLNIDVGIFIVMPDGEEIYTDSHYCEENHNPNGKLYHRLDQLRRRSNDVGKLKAILERNKFGYSTSFEQNKLGDFEVLQITDERAEEGSKGRALTHSNPGYSVEFHFQETSDVHSELRGIGVGVHVERD